MNILYLSADRNIPIRGRRGASVQIRSMSDAFRRAGHQMTLMTPRPGPADGPLPNVKITHIPFPPSSAIPDKNKTAYQQSQLYRDILFNAAHKVITRQRFDFIYERHSLWSDTGARLAMAARLPLVLEVNAPLRLQAGRQGGVQNPSQAALIELTQLAFATAVVVRSERLRQYVVERGAKAERVHVLPNGFDPRLFHPAVNGNPVRRRHDLRDRFLIGTISQKGLDLRPLLQSVAELSLSDPRIHLMIVGEMDEEVKAWIEYQELAAKITLAGLIPHEQIAQYMAAMDVGVILSTKESYRSPVQLAEYLACGVPTIIVGAANSTPFLVDGETGWLISPAEPHELTARLRSIITNSNYAGQIAWQGAVAMSNGWTWDDQAAEVVRLVCQGPLSLGKPHHTSPALLDPTMRRELYRATRRDLVKGVLASNLSLFNGNAREQLMAVDRIEKLDYEPGQRCVLGYEMWGRCRTNGRPIHHRIVGKLFPDERGARLDRLGQWLWDFGFDRDAPDRIVIPEPLGYVPGMKMLLQAYAAGRPLNRLVGKKRIAQLVIRAAEGLVKLHRTQMPKHATTANGRRALLPLFRLSDELARLEEDTADLVNTRPQLQPELGLYPAALQTWADGLPPPADTAFTFRGSSIKYLLFDHARLTLINIEKLVEGDAASDVGGFAAELYYLGLSSFGDIDAFAGEVALFLDAYGRLRLTDAGFWDRVEFYQTAAMFRLLTTAVVIHPQNPSFAALVRRVGTEIRQKSAAFAFSNITPLE